MRPRGVVCITTQDDPYPPPPPSAGGTPSRHCRGQYSTTTTCFIMGISLCNGAPCDGFTTKITTHASRVPKWRCLYHRAKVTPHRLPLSTPAQGVLLPGIARDDVLRRRHASSLARPSTLMLSMVSCRTQPTMNALRAFNGGDNLVTHLLGIGLEGQALFLLSGCFMSLGRHTWHQQRRGGTGGTRR